MTLLPIGTPAEVIGTPRVPKIIELEEAAGKPVGALAELAWSSIPLLKSPLDRFVGDPSVSHEPPVLSYLWRVKLLLATANATRYRVALETALNLADSKTVEIFCASERTCQALNELESIGMDSAENKSTKPTTTVTSAKVNPDSHFLIRLLN